MAGFNETLKQVALRVPESQVLMVMGGYCTKARAYLAGLGVSVTEHDIERDPGRGEEMRAKSGSRGVPVVDVEGIIIRGYAPDQIRAAVEKRRAL